MFNLGRLLNFVWRILRVAMPFLLGLLVLSTITEVLAHRSELDTIWRDWKFWGAVVGNMIPLVAVSAFVFWLAARFVRDLYKLDNWKAGLGFLMRSRFGLPGFGPWMKVEKGAITSKEGGILTRVGGPGHLVVYNDSAVVLECAGRLTRVVAPGFPRLEPFEKVYEVIDLRPKRWVYPVKAMTKDGILITWNAEVHYQIGDDGQESSEKTPYPFSQENVFKASTSRWVFVGRPTKMDWEGLMVIGNTEGGLRTILARWWLNQLIGLTEQEEQAARQAVQKQLEKVLRDDAPKIGAKVLAVKLDNFQVEDEITQQWIEAWKTSWRAWSRARLAQGEAAQLYLYETAKAEAQMSLLVSIGQALHGLVSRDTVVPHIILARLFSVLDRASFSASSRIFFPTEALKALENMKNLLASGADTGVATVTVIVNPASVPVDSRADLVATVKNTQGNPVPNGTVVQFVTTLGTLSSDSALTFNGQARTTLFTGTIAGETLVTATADGVSDQITISITPGPPAVINLVAIPDRVPLGWKADLIARVEDNRGNRVSDRTQVDFTTTLGDLLLTPAFTNNGLCHSTLLAGPVTGFALITASANGVSGQTIVQIRDDVSNIAQTVVGQNVVNIGTVNGGVVNVAPAGQRAEDRIRPHSSPPHIRPRRVHEFLNREQELGLVGQALARNQVVDVHGPDGVGKTALISQAMWTQLPDAFPHGQVYLSGRQEIFEDLLQELFESFFTANRGHVKASEDQIRRYMSGIKALIALDDVNDLEDGDIDTLAQVVPDCAIIIAGQQQQVWQGVSVALHGLPRDQAIRLFERHWGLVPAQDRSVLEAICDGLGNMPELVIALAKQKLPLAVPPHGVQLGVGQQDSVGWTFGLLKSRLSPEQQRTLGGLAAAGGSTVGVDALAEITGISLTEINRHLDYLAEMHLVQAHSPRYSLTEVFRHHIEAAWATQELRARAADFYRRQADQLQSQSKDPDEENVIAALTYYFQHQQWKPVVDIIRAVEPYLVAAARWGQWHKRLVQAWEASKALGDLETEAWALNQLGLIATCLQEPAKGKSLFESALATWKALGNQAGITVSSWNLLVLTSDVSTSTSGSQHEKTGHFADNRSFDHPSRRGRISIPILSPVSAGELMLAEEEFEGWIDVDEALADEANFALRVQGDSMIGAGIQDGDLVLIEKKDGWPPAEGIVAIRIEGTGSKIKLEQFHRESDHIRLEPANVGYPLIIIKPEQLSEAAIHTRYAQSHPKRLLQIHSEDDIKIIGWVKGKVSRSS